MQIGTVNSEFLKIYKNHKGIGERRKSIKGGQSGSVGKPHPVPLATKNLAAPLCFYCTQTRLRGFRQATPLEGRLEGGMGVQGLRLQ